MLDFIFNSYDILIGRWRCFFHFIDWSFFRVFCIFQGNNVIISRWKIRGRICSNTSSSTTWSNEVVAFKESSTISSVGEIVNKKVVLIIRSITLNLLTKVETQTQAQSCHRTNAMREDKFLPQYMRGSDQASHSICSICICNCCCCL